MKQRDRQSILRQQFLNHAPSLHHEPFYTEETTDGYGHGECIGKPMGDKDRYVLDGLFNVFRGVARLPETDCRAFLNVEAASGDQFRHVQKNSLFSTLNDSKRIRRYSQHGISFLAI